MMHRMLRFPSHWEWHMLHQPRPATQGLSRRDRGRMPARPGEDLADHEDLPRPILDQQQAAAASYAELRQAHPELRRWLEDTLGQEQNCIQVSELAGGIPVLYGTLLFQASEDHRDMAKLHYWVTPDKLVTLQSDLRLSIQLQAAPWQDKLERAQHAVEALFILLSCLLEQLHIGLDSFEARLGEIERTMHVKNQTSIMNVIFDRRYDLLHWNHLFLPIQEIQGAAKEAFLDAVADTEEFKRFQHKLDRIASLLQQYAMEIDTLLTMDDAISSFRGNDIMKTLTIFTALLMPATVAGAFWGMNFNLLPWTDKPAGFAFIILIVAAVTAAIYWWLWHKGWTGDLLKTHKDKQQKQYKQQYRQRLRQQITHQIKQNPVYAGRDEAPSKLPPRKQKHLKRRDKPVG